MLNNKKGARNVYYDNKMNRKKKLRAFLQYTYENDESIAFLYTTCCYWDVLVTINEI